MAVRTLSMWDEGACRRVHEATAEILRETGVEVYNEEARGLLADAGADVQGTRVRIGASLVEAALKTAPRSFPVRGRGNGQSLTMEAGTSYFGTGSDCLYYCDPETHKRRRAILADVEVMARLIEQLPNIDFMMSMALPVDVPQAVDDLAPFAAMLRRTRKPLAVATHDACFLETMLDMADLCGDERSFVIYSMSSPPLMHSREGVDKLLGCARLGIPVIYTPAPAPAAQAPASLSATAVVANAEILSGLVIHQLAREGAPFILGTNINYVNMREANVSYGAPECWIMQQTHTDLARYYGLPSFGYAGCSDSKVCDEQWSAEAGITALLGAIAGATLIHDVGFLESGLQSSLESIVLGDELIGYARACLRDLPVDDHALALDEIKAVGPGGHHLGRDYTRKHYRGFWQPSLLDDKVHDRWAKDGSMTLLERARAKARDLLDAQGAYALDDSCAVALADRVRQAAVGQIA